MRLGVVEKTLRGKDGVIRGAVVRIKEGSNVSSFMRRPIQRLYPLEVRPRKDTSIDRDTELMEGSTRTLEEGSNSGVMADAEDFIGGASNVEDGAVKSHPMDVPLYPTLLQTPTSCSKSGLKSDHCETHGLKL